MNIIDFSVEIKEIIKIFDNINYLEDNKKLDLTGKKILVVDDNKINIKVAITLLKKYNCEIDTVLSGYECLEKIDNNNSFDMILLDEMMPGMTGTETMKKLKKKGYKKPIVVFTADAVTGQREHYLSQGFDDYLEKPN